MDWLPPAASTSTAADELAVIARVTKLADWENLSEVREPVVIAHGHLIQPFENSSPCFRGFAWVTSLVVLHFGKKAGSLSRMTRRPDGFRLDQEDVSVTIDIELLENQFVP